MALVIDYKSGKRVDSYKVGSWEGENRFQAALYMLVVERLLGLRAAGGVYVPLGSDDAPRGMVAEDVDELGSDFTSNDVLPPDEFRAKLDWALGQVRDDRRPHAPRRARLRPRRRAPGTAAARTPRSAGARDEPALTARAGARGRRAATAR